MTLRTFSFGGGVQSTAVLVLAALGRVQYDAFLFANVGDDSENPETLEYIERYAKPYAAKHGIEIVTLQKLWKGKPETLYGRIQRSERSLPLPVRMSNGAPGRRTCTADFKIDVIAKWQKQHGATKADPAVCGLGISIDEIHRARVDSGIAWQTLEYPLLDLRMFRRDCVNLIESVGLAVPPKSSCYFCPFHNRDEWKRLKREQPDLFLRAVDMEKMLNGRRGDLGKDQIFLHSALMPLDQAVGDQMAFDFTETDDLPCDTGHCFI